MSALSRTSSSTASAWPMLAAHHSAVLPLRSLASRSAPAATRPHSTRAPAPSAAARISGLRPSASTSSTESSIAPSALHSRSAAFLVFPADPAACSPSNVRPPRPKSSGPASTAASLLVYLRQWEPDFLLRDGPLDLKACTVTVTVTARHRARAGVGRRAGGDAAQADY
jgi:hypothetical protein